MNITRPGGKTTIDLYKFFSFVLFNFLFASTYGYKLFLFGLGCEVFPLLAFHSLWIAQTGLGLYIFYGWNPTTIFPVGVFDIFSLIRGRLSGSFWISLFQLKGYLFCLSWRRWRTNLLNFVLIHLDFPPIIRTPCTITAPQPYFYSAAVTNFGFNRRMGGNLWLCMYVYLVE